MLERIVPPLRASSLLRQSIEWFVFAYAIIMPVAMAILDGVQCVSGGCRGGAVVGAAVMGFKNAFDPTNLTWHLAHAAMIAVTAGVFGYLLDKSHKREQALLQVNLVGNTITGIISAVERTLGQNIITVCAYCNMMRDGNADDAPWVRPQTYLVNHMTEIKDPLQHLDFSHGICPRCVQREFPGVMSALTKTQ